MAVYVTGPLIGFVIAPVTGGFIAQNIGFKYVFIIISALCGLAALIGIPFLRETYAPVIRLRLARSSNLEKATQTFAPENQSIGRIMWLNLSRPVTLLTRSFICFILSLYLAM
jgi:MFS family permease